MSVIVFVIATVAVAAMFVAGYVLGRRSMGDQREEMRLQMNLISEQLKTTTENVLKTRQQELGESNRQQVSQIIDPLQRSLAEMSRALEDNRLQQRDALTRLDATIQANMKQSSALGERADRLTRALTGEVKIQGTFGELKLRQLLEDMELREGEQYDTQETLRDSSGRAVKSEDGSSLIPDYILHFPQNRHVVVDCKMSLTAYERYVNSDTQEERTMHLQEHLRSVRQQVKVLARKDYTRYLPKGYNKLNFAIMYLPIEGALNLALENDSGLWNEAYREGVMILGPQTMYMNLRVLEMMWTQIRQLENQEQMMKAANTIVERVQEFSKRFDDVEHSMQDTMRKMDSLRITTADSGPGIITAARALIKAGAQENRRKKPLENKTLEQD